MSETPSIIVSLSALTAVLVPMRLLLLRAAVRPPAYSFTFAQVNNRWNPPVLWQTNSVCKRDGVMNGLCRLPLSGICASHAGGCVFPSCL